MKWVQSWNSPTLIKWYLFWCHALLNLEVSSYPDFLYIFWLLNKLRHLFLFKYRNTSLLLQKSWCERMAQPSLCLQATLPNLLQEPWRSELLGRKSGSFQGTWTLLTQMQVLTSMVSQPTSGWSNVWKFYVQLFLHP